MNRDTWRKLQWPVIALALVLLFNFIFTKRFFHLEFKEGRLYGSLVDILNRGTPVALLALGMTLVIATGGIDLSVGAVMAVIGAMASWLITHGHSSLVVVIGVSLGAAIFFGLWNGMLVGYFKVPPIIATLVLMVAGRGLAQLINDGQTVSFEHPSFEFIGRGHLFAIPFPVTILTVAFLVLGLFRQRTAAGLFIEAVGDNEVGSRYSGVNPRQVKLLVYAVCGLCAGLAGLIATSNIMTSDPGSAGLNLELDAILACVIGGASLQGGRFSLAGSIVGAMLIQTLTTTILTRGIPDRLTLVVKALVIVGICLLQSHAFRRIFRRFRTAPA